ncbi:MAG: HAD family hydrolase [Anaerolineae bacterium]|nr:HAD family hydrolase [Anaerolineae bacterium]
MMQALVFDFDGLIIDSETPEYESWQELYQAHGTSLPFELWVTLIGVSTADSPLDLYDYLENQIHQPVDRALIRAQRRARFGELFDQQPVLPGVLDYLAEARRLNLKLAVASSGTSDWVKGNLERLGLMDWFEAVCCAEDVPRSKPDPALYDLALRRLGVSSSRAIALEDSPNGLFAAKSAGLYAVAVPNAMTCTLNFDHADLRLTSLADLPLTALLEQANSGRI